MLTPPVAAFPSKRKKLRRVSLFSVAFVLFAIGLPTDAQATFTIFGPFPPIATTYGVGTLAIVPPTTNSPAPWLFTSSNTNVATVSGKTLNIVGVGYATIIASQAATGKFTARSRPTQLRVSQGTPTFGAFAPQSISIAQLTYTIVPPTSTSDGIWSFSSSNPIIASVVGNLVTFHQGGSVMIYGIQSGARFWKTAGTSMRLTVVTLSPNLGTFGDISIMKDSVASLTLLPPKSSSSGAWIFTSSNPTVASIVGNVVTPMAFGTTQITATQAAFGNYGSASATMTLAVQGPLPTVGAFPDVMASLAASQLVVLTAPTSTSSGGWTFSSSDTSVATVSGQVANLLKPGTTTITASQAATITYAPPVPLTMTLTVEGNPTIGSLADVQKVVNDPDFTITAPTSTSNGAWSFVSSNLAVIDIVNGVAKVKGAGKTTITGTQAATKIWTQGTTTFSVQVFGHIPTVGIFAPISATVGDAQKLISPPQSNSSGTWSYVSSDPKVATINGTSLVIVGAGSATISATQNSSGEYSQSNIVQTTLTVKPKPSPSPSPSPTPTSKPSSSPSPRPSPTPSVTGAPINATLKVSASGRILTVVAIGVKPLVFINGKPGKVGRNAVKPGVASVVITINDKVVYRKAFTIK